MKVAITGASGFVGKQIVPCFSSNGDTLLLIGRDKAKLKKLFPNHKYSDYGEIDQSIKDYDILIHLSALNNNHSNKSLNDYIHINVNLALDVFKKAKKSGVKKIYNFSTVHCLQSNKTDHYTISKRNLLDHIDRNAELNVTSILLPAIYGEVFSNKLSFLNSFPKNIRQLFVKIISSFKATISISKIYDFLIQEYTDIHSKTVIIANDQNINFFYRTWNKIIDISFIIFVLIGFWWLLILIFVVIKCSSDGPAIYKQKRVGKCMNEFICYKFRTMKTDTPSLATHNIAQSNVTNVGRVLRKYKLDELPQIINLIKGEMSLIGPRPCLPNQLDLIEQRAKRNIFDLHPGITGWAAINDIDMSDPKLLAKTDEEYLKLRSIYIDIKIISNTILGSGLRDRTR